MSILMDREPGENTSFLVTMILVIGKIMFLSNRKITSAQVPGPNT